eukprot:CAMPEP_0177631876 /NCGR_PEP_ID=MMETSP0447-20121125/1982_1 /TAXON_ID=0 /ORGANISM="Stygamoeba regulata, Strain BSH-02190019" /LENGTH=915 /DNA_ID=CAMNT_0019133387 /DNA_START=115 /DNA_END=2863 /DNA_ORIENTATION=+
MTKRRRVGPFGGHDAEFATPGTISVVDFVQARKADIQELLQALSRRTDNRRVHQALPKHMRRRAANHTIRRLPRKLRAQAAQEMEAFPPAPKKKVSRKGKRRPGYLQANFGRRQNTFKWLETHVWHAKRMFMKALWGYKLAITPCDKGFRAAYRGVSAAAILAAMASVSYPANILSFKRHSEGRHAAQVLLHHPGMHPRGLICPATAVWTSAGALVLWVHPLAAEEALAVLHARALEKENIVGPRAHDVVSAVLQPAGNPQTAASQAWQRLAAMHNPAVLPKGCAISLSVSDPRIHFPPPPLTAAGKIVEGALTGDVEDDVANMLVTWPCSAASPLWCRERRAHMRDTRRPTHVVNAEKMMPSNSSPHCSAAVDVVLLQWCAGRDAAAAGWALIMPAGVAMDFWTSLVYAGARAIGLRDFKRILWESEAPVFPDDFPDCEAHRVNARRIGVEETARYRLRPPAKRTNYMRLKVECPFYPIWERVAPSSPPAAAADMYVVREPRVLACLRVLVECASGNAPGSRQQATHDPHALVLVALDLPSGTPHGSAMVCLPSEDDYCQYARGSALQLDEPTWQAKAARTLTRLNQSSVSIGGSQETAHQGVHGAPPRGSTSQTDGGEGKGGKRSEQQSRKRQAGEKRRAGVAAVEGASQSTAGKRVDPNSNSNSKNNNSNNSNKNNSNNSNNSNSSNNNSNSSNSNSNSCRNNKKKKRAAGKCTAGSTENTGSDANRMMVISTDRGKAGAISSRTTATTTTTATAAAPLTTTAAVATTAAAACAGGVHFHALLPSLKCKYIDRGALHDATSTSTTTSTSTSTTTSSTPIPTLTARSMALRDITHLLQCMRPPSPVRAVVGYVSSGAFSYTAGAGRALAYLPAATLADRANRFLAGQTAVPPWFVLLRNSTSTRYYPATLRVL